MSRLFKANQFAMEAHFRASCVATFAFPTEQLKPLVPAPLVIEAYQGYSFVAAAFVDTKNLRPKGFPSIFGRDFILAGYRIFVDYTDKRGKRLRGLYILGSETNSSTMVRLGNRLSNYAYQWSDLSTEFAESSFRFFDRESGNDVSFITDDPVLPEGSVFPDWKTARRFAGPMPFTFSVNQHKVNIVEGVRQNWQPKHASVVTSEIPMLEKLGLFNGVLSSGFVVEDVPYHWKKNRSESWQNEDHSKAFQTWFDLIGLCTSQAWVPSYF